MESASAIAPAGNAGNVEYETFLFRINERFNKNIANGAPLFTTKANLWDLFLFSFFEPDRQYHNCHACRNFLTRYGGLATIDPMGYIRSAVWSPADPPLRYSAAVEGMIDAVETSTITGIFYSKDLVWGHPITGKWTHFSVVPPASHIHQNATMTPKQAMAEKREDFKNILAAMRTYTKPVVEQALTLLETDALYRSEKVLGHALWLLDLHLAIESCPKRLHRNKIWLAVAKAPAGFCHPKTSMIGTLLDDIAAGVPFYDIERRFRSKMNPTQYRRPQAAPKAGQIEVAEKIIKSLGLENSLRRRFARIDDIETIWKPRPVGKGKPQGDGVFSHLKSRSNVIPIGGTDIPPKTITWKKFEAEVLPGAVAIDFFVTPQSNAYTALVTAADLSAPPILQWDFADKRNPVSWYVYPQGSLPSQWGLQSNQWCKVNALAYKPSMWAAPQCWLDQMGKGVIFILEGAKDTQNLSLAIFPETLKADLHRIRATIEAFSKSKNLEGEAEASACGIMLQAGVRWVAVFRVTTDRSTISYRLDRWD